MTSFDKKVYRNLNMSCYKKDKPCKMRQENQLLLYMLFHLFVYKKKVIKKTSRHNFKYKITYLSFVIAYSKVILAKVFVVSIKEILCADRVK